MEPFSRRRWTAIPAQWVSNSVHEVFFCFSYKCISSLLDLPRGRYGCSSLAFKGLLGSAINWRTRWRLQTILRFTVFHFILRFTVFCAQKEGNFIFAKKEKFFGLTNFLGQWKNWPKWNEKGYTPVTPPPTNLVQNDVSHYQLCRRLEPWWLHLFMIKSWWVRIPRWLILHIYLLLNLTKVITKLLLVNRVQCDQIGWFLNR